MIHPKELCIGNWVKNSSGCAFQIDGSHIMTAQFYQGQLFPIQVTPEILESIQLELKGKRKELFYELAEEKPYVHQLQNLYFALTGEDLVVNIPKAVQSSATA